MKNGGRRKVERKEKAGRTDEQRSSKKGKWKSTVEKAYYNIKHVTHNTPTETP